MFRPMDSSSVNLIQSVDYIYNLLEIDPLDSDAPDLKSLNARIGEGSG